jgi:hypothetical protein
VPLWLFFGYCFYFAGPYMAAFSRIANNSFTSKEVWIGFFGAVIGAMIIEIYAVHNHVWIYYDHQALWFWKSTIPVTWAFINATCVFVPLTAIKFLFPILIGWKQWLIIVLSPMFAIMGHLGAGFPFYLVNNSAASSNRGLMDLSGVASILMSLLLIFICNKVLTFKQQIS